MERRIICFGDSNTYGLNPVTNGRYDRENRWTWVMEQTLKEKGYDFDVVSEGLGGRTTLYGSEYQKYLNSDDYLMPCLLSHAPADLVIFMLGTNDFAMGCKTAEESLASLDQLVQRADHYPIWPGKRPFKSQSKIFSKRILITAPAVLEVPEKFLDFPEEQLAKLKGQAAFSREIVPLYKEYAEKKGYGFLDVNDFAKVGDHDGIHLTPEAHVALGKAFAEKVIELMEAK